MSICYGKPANNGVPPTGLPFSALWLVCALFLAACASTPKPQLSPPSAIPPADTALSGRWQLRNEDEDPLREFTHQGFIGTGSAQQVIRLSRAAGRGRSATALDERPRNDRRRAALVQVFLETGSDIKITQTKDGLFVSFDRSIVEEYIFGEHRVATVGPVIAERVSGWEGERYVVQTLDEDNVLLTEAWYLQEDGRVLMRDVVLSEDALVQYAVTQVFDRADSGR
ncbi:MAG: hypothetical protein AAGE85_07490 [Pseudomonadota bacterium]